MTNLSIDHKLLPADLQAIAQEAARISLHAVDRAAAHLADAAKFTLPAGARLETAALSLLKQRASAKPRGLRKLQAKAQSRLSAAPAAGLASGSVLSHLRAQPSLAVRGTLAELHDLKPTVRAMPLADITITALKQAEKDQDTAAMLHAMGMAFSVPQGDPAAKVATPTRFNELKLQLHQVKCQDDVGLELTDFFEDDIHLGCGGAETTTGQEVKGQPFKVGQFRAGTVKSFPPRTLASFDLTRPGAWPRRFEVSLLMAELDGSGAFLEAMQELWGAVHEVVEDLIVQAAMAGGAAVGLATGGPVGVLIGAVVGAAVGLVVNALFKSLEDDVFDPATLTQSLDGPGALFGGSRKSGFRTVQLRHPSALYTLKYQWELA